MRSPTAPKISPPVAQPMTKMLVMEAPNSLIFSGGVPGFISAMTAGLRAITNTCWPRQSNSQASDARTKTFFCKLLRVFHQE